MNLKDAIKDVIEEIQNLSDDDFKKLMGESDGDHICHPDTCDGQCQGMGWCDVAKKFWEDAE